MAQEGTYQYDCGRAELLGADAPNQNDWEQNERARNEHAAMTVSFIQKPNLHYSSPNLHYYS